MQGEADDEERALRVQRFESLRWNSQTRTQWREVEGLMFRPLPGSSFAAPVRLINSDPPLELPRRMREFLGLGWAMNTASPPLVQCVLRLLQHPWEQVGNGRGAVYIMLVSNLYSKLYLGFTAEPDLQHGLPRPHMLLCGLYLRSEAVGRKLGKAMMSGALLHDSVMATRDLYVPDAAAITSQVIMQSKTDGLRMLTFCDDAFTGDMTILPNSNDYQGYRGVVVYPLNQSAQAAPAPRQTPAFDGQEALREFVAGLRAIPGFKFDLTVTYYARDASIRDGRVLFAANESKIISALAAVADSGHL